MIFDEMNYDIDYDINNYGIKYPHNLFVGFWPIPETDGLSEMHIKENYRAVACTYQTELQVWNHPEEIVVSDHDKRPWISIEEARPNMETTEFQDFVFPDEAIYLTGNSEWRHLSDVLRVDHVITVPTPGGYMHPLYGAQVAAIVMQEAYAQRLQRLSSGSEESQASSVYERPVEPAQM